MKKSKTKKQANRKKEKKTSLNKKNKSNTQKIEKISKQVLKQIVPTKEELKKEKKVFEEIKEKILEVEGEHSHVEWCGSSARDTHLKNDRDIDIFVMFKSEMKEEKLEKEITKIASKVFGKKWEKAYSQHPYARGSYKGYSTEIVPGYIVKKGSEKKSAVDRTPFHNKFIIKNMKKKQKNEARLLKQFLKGIDAYGADLKNCSLPGYGIELIILKYGSFKKSLEKISNWKKGEKIVFNKNKNPKFKDPLIIIDPVDPNRNVASAVSIEQFERIIYASKKFLEKPMKKFFFKKKKKRWSVTKVKKMFEKKELIAIKAPFPKKYLEDIIWGQLRRMLKKIGNYIEEKDFKIERKKMWSDCKEVWFIFELETLTLQKSKKIIGPRFDDEENVKKFLEKKRKILSGPRIEGEKIVLETERTITTAKDALKLFIKEYKKEEKEAMKEMLKKAIVIDEKGIVKNYKGEFADFLTTYLEGKEIFE